MQNLFPWKYFLWNYIRNKKDDLLIALITQVKKTRKYTLKNYLEIYFLFLKAILYYVIIFGDFNVNVKEVNIWNVCCNCDLKSLIKDPTDFKVPEKSTVMDIILTGFPLSLLNSCVVETGQSDFHKMALPIFKMTCKKSAPIKINYKDYKSWINTSQ